MAVVNDDGFVLDNKWRALILLQWCGGEHNDDATASTTAATSVINNDSFVLDSEQRVLVLLEGDDRLFLPLKT